MTASPWCGAGPTGARHISGARWHRAGASGGPCGAGSAGIGAHYTCIIHRQLLSPAICSRRRGRRAAAAQRGSHSPAPAVTPGLPPRCGRTGCGVSPLHPAVMLCGVLGASGSAMGPTGCREVGRGFAPLWSCHRCHGPRCAALRRMLFPPAPSCCLVLGRASMPGAGQRLFLLGMQQLSSPYTPRSIFIPPPFN